MALATTELCKEFAFGAAAGLAAGYLSKKAGSAAVAAAGAVSFVCLRAAIFDGHHLATWSPLEACSFSFIRVSAHSRTLQSFSLTFNLIYGLIGKLPCTSSLPPSP